MRNENDWNEEMLKRQRAELSREISLGIATAVTILIVGLVVA